MQLSNGSSIRAFAGQISFILAGMIPTVDAGRFESNHGLASGIAEVDATWQAR